MKRIKCLTLVQRQVAYWKPLRALELQTFVILAICGFNFESQNDQKLQFASILSFKNQFTAAKYT